MEAYHVIATHPHQMLMSGDCRNTDYDVFGNWGRAAQFPSPGSPQRGIMVTPGGGARTVPPRRRWPEEV